jgi:charged multivesicular body protein 4
MNAIKSWWSGEGKKKPVQNAEEVASSQELIQGLKLKKMQQLQRAHQLEQQAKQAKQRGDIQNAIALMKQKSVIDTRVRQLTGQIHNVEQQNTVRETAAISEQMARAMQHGNREISELMQNVTVDEVEDIADDMAELSVTTYDMTDALSKPMGEAYMPIDVDEQIAAQMAAWDAETQQTTGPPRERNDVDILDKMPSVPVTRDGVETADAAQNGDSRLPPMMYQK